MENIYEIKVSKMPTDELIKQAIAHLRLMEKGKLDEASKIRATILFTAASERDTLEDIRHDFLTALSVLKYL